jgi:hypothetical protein
MPAVYVVPDGCYTAMLTERMTRTGRAVACTSSSLSTGGACKTTNYYHQ